MSYIYVLIRDGIWNEGQPRYKILGAYTSEDKVMNAMADHERRLVSSDINGWLGYYTIATDIECGVSSPWDAAQYANSIERYHEQ